MDKNSIVQYKLSFDSITHYIESEDRQERVENYGLHVSCKPYWAMLAGRILLLLFIDL